ncbi:MAG: ABC transporter substrate-binding protein [Alphaproteobacteria bacterium]|nr:ABC transporter substrate-binding protein [Alphaproteobacteria bacterium]
MGLASGVRAPASSGGTWRRSAIRYALGIAALACLGAGGAPPVVAILASAELRADGIDAFRQSLHALGLIDGRNLNLEYVAGEGDYGRLSAMAADLAKRRVAVIIAISLPAARAAQAATSSVPILFVAGADPVATKLVASLNRPGGNVTGVTNMLGELGPKRLEIILELVPDAKRLGLVSNPTNQNAESHARSVIAAANAAGREVIVRNAKGEDDIVRAIADFAALGVGAVLVADDPVFTAKHETLVESAARFKLPAIYYAATFVEHGGLISYGPRSGQSFPLLAGYVARILKGAKPADLPVHRPTAFDLVVNLKTARALGLAVPSAILYRADAVIE